MKFTATLIIAVATVAASTADACWLRTNSSVEFASMHGIDASSDLGLTAIDQDQKLCKEDVRLDVFKTSGDATTGLMCVRGKKAQRKFCGDDEVACCAAGKLSDKAKAALGIAAAPIAAPSVADATVVSSAGAVAPVVEAPVVASAGIAEAPVVASAGIAAAQDPSTVGTAAAAPYLPSIPSTVGTATAAQEVAPVAALSGQVVPVVPIAPTQGASTIAPGPTGTLAYVPIVTGVVQSATTSAAPVAATAGSAGSQQIVGVGCWRPLSGVVHFASLAGVNLSSDAGLTNVVANDSLCDSSARVDVHTSNDNKRFGMVCVRGQEAQREFCGGKVACCAPGRFVIA